MYHKRLDEKHAILRIVDLRSDTLAVPTDEMRNAIFEAVVGDDVYGEDPTVNTLEIKAAEIFDKEAALFVPSGSMANLLAVMVHCNKRGSEAFMGHMSHTFKYEQGTASAIANVFVNKVHNFDDGTFSIDEVKEGIRGNDAHEPLSQLVCIENTHNMAGGKVLPLDWIEELSKVCKENNLKLHMDGARIFNAAEFLKLPVSRIVRDVDSVCFCLSKNLCCPVGSVLLGTKTFINEARRYRKALGGGMRQAGFLAAPGLYAMENIVPLLGIDHQHARQLAEAIDNLKSSIFQVELENLQTNILMIKVNKNSMNIAAQDFCNRLAEVKESEVANGICDEMKTPIIIKSGVKNASTLRVVFYRQIDDQLTQLAIKKVSHIIGEFEALLSTHTTD